MASRRLAASIVTVLALASSGREARAREISGGGDGLYVTLHEETVELKTGAKLRQFQTRGFLTAEPGSLFASTEQNCSGTELTSADGASVTAAGYCDGTDPAGDVWWIWWRGDRDGGVWGLLGGTGKFAGLKGGGSSRNVQRWPNGKFTTKWEGRWTSE